MAASSGRDVKDELTTLEHSTLKVGPVYPHHVYYRDFVSALVVILAAGAV